MKIIHFYVSCLRLSEHNLPTVYSLFITISTCMISYRFDNFYLSYETIPLSFSDHSFTVSEFLMALASFELSNIVEHHACEYSYTYLLFVAFVFLKQHSPLAFELAICTFSNHSSSALSVVEILLRRT